MIITIAKSASVPGSVVTTSDVQDFQITFQQRRLFTSADPAASDAYLNYQVVIPSTRIPVGEYQQQLVDSVNSNTFTNTLQEVAKSLKVPALANAQAVSMVFAQPSAFPTAYPASSSSNDGLSAGAIAGIVIGSVAGAALLAGLLYYFLSTKATGDMKAPLNPNAEETRSSIDGKPKTAIFY